MMLAHRSPFLLGAALALMAGCSPSDPAPPVAEREMRSARAWANQLPQIENRSADSIPAEAAISLGYLERLRLGMGSPFRLVEFALHDPRLTPEARTRLAWALLYRTRAGEGHRIDAEALHAIDQGSARPVWPGGSVHAALMEEAFAEADDPRVGELVVRMVYALSAAEGIVGPSALSTAASAASLLRDRHLAQADARALLHSARRIGVSPLALLPLWRRERRFQVEAPTVLSPGPEVEGAAIRMVPHLMARLLPTTWDDPPAAAAENHTLLGAVVAARLLKAAERLDLPPQGPVSATLAAHRAYLLPAGGVPHRAEARERFLDGAWNEERFVAEYAMLRHAAAGGPEAAVVALAVSVGMRAYAQEAVWYPGLSAPSEDELRTRYGLTSVSFDGSVREAWRPYYLRMLDASLADMIRVFPTAGLEGVRVRFGELDRQDALATHSPRTRTVTLPARTGAGTLAHELAHDLDWQAAHLRYGTRTAYRTDRAALGARDHLAAALQQLAPEHPQGPAAITSSAFSRPTELFARNVDWYVAAALAREGRSNGYLSAVQDRVITGYAAAAPPDADGRAGEAIIRLLDEVAPVPHESRRWFLERYGSGRSPSAFALMEAILASPLPEPGATGAVPGRPLFGARPLSRPLIADEAQCAPQGWERVLGSDPVRRDVAELAFRARARGLALAQAGRLAGPAGREWMARQLQGRLWSPLPVDSATAHRVQPLLVGLEKSAWEPAGSTVMPGRSPACRGFSPTIAQGVGGARRPE
ncbi:MAG: hypothetical protein M3418_06525 [Gemmatimonadota bacterium]|nr:hypothetical protein [Gemmatimonadota bacterium]